MLIRKMGPEDIPEVSAMVVESFSHSVAGDLSDEGVATFMELSSPEAFRRRMQEDNCMLVHEEAGEIMGMVELKEGRHVAMLFVAPGKQRHGVGRGLVREVLKHRRTHCVTVSASISSVPAYESFGFRATGPEKESEGLRYVPMSIECGEKVSLI